MTVNSKLKIQHSKFLVVLALSALLAACVMPVPALEPTTPESSPPAATPILLPTLPPTSTPDPSVPYVDARDLFSGVCFEYWVEQVNRVYVISTPFEHIEFYNEVDESERCRFPVERLPFDEFETRLLLGAVNVGTGCQAITDPLELVTDEAARTVTLRVQWGVTGDCPYRLARPFFVHMARPPEGYRIEMEFVPLPDAETPAG